MRVPKELSGLAADYWKRNAGLCISMGTLTDADKDSFIVLCQTWEKLQSCVANGDPVHSYICLAKAFQTAVKSFGLDPLSRKKLAIEDKSKTDLDEFGI